MKRYVNGWNDAMDAVIAEAEARAKKLEESRGQDWDAGREAERSALLHLAVWASRNRSRPYPPV